MRAPDLQPALANLANPHATGRIARRRLVLLLAVSAGALATLAGCGGDEPLTRDNYEFPGARKDSTGNYQMRNAQ